MKNLETRRVVPVGVVVLVIFAILVILEVGMMAGLYEIKASTVKKVAPWAYEPFLKWVGEHPDTRPDWAAGQGKPAETNVVEASSGVALVAGFSPEELSVEIDTNLVIEPSVPVEEASPVVPVLVPTNTPAPKAEPKEIVPVG